MSTLTHRVAAIQVKMFHLQFRMKKIFEDQAILNSKLPTYKTPREKTKGAYTAVYTAIDMLVTFEHMFQLMNEIFNTPELKELLDQRMIRLLGNVRKIAKKWKHVRNKLGGHIDIDIVERFCEDHDYVGVFISDDLEADICLLNLLLVESAINSTREKEDLLGRELSFRNNGIDSEMKLFVETLNNDWNTVFNYFEPMMQFMYKVGKEEKIKHSDPKLLKGILSD